MLANNACEGNVVHTNYWSLYPVVHSFICSFCVAFLWHQKKDSNLLFKVYVWICLHESYMTFVYLMGSVSLLAWHHIVIYIF